MRTYSYFQEEQKGDAAGGEPNSDDDVCLPFPLLASICGAGSGGASTTASTMFPMACANYASMCLPAGSGGPSAVLQCRSAASPSDLQSLLHLDK
jgi:hypothetical protein